MDSFAAGIVPYIIIEKTYYFLLGLERSNHLWSGFVGGSEKKETIEQTALREFNEETGGIFEDYLPYVEKELKNISPNMDISGTGKNVYIYFLEFPDEIQEHIKNFKFIDESCYHEKSILRWFTLDEIKKQRKMLYSLQKMIVNIYLKF